MYKIAGGDGVILWACHFEAVFYSTVQNILLVSGSDTIF